MRTPTTERAMPRIGFGYQIVPRGQGDPATEPYPSHRLMLQDAQRAAQLGFDSIWVPDHFYMQRPTKLETYPDAWTLLTAIGMTTERVRLGTQVIAAGFRHPALLAKMAGALQELCGGRLLLGIGAGNQSHEHAAFGFDFERRIGRFKEYLAVLTGLLNGETVTLEGRHYTLREASLHTAVPKVPLLIASGGEQMLALTARYASAWNPVGAGWDPAALRAKYDALARACRQIDRDVRDLEVSHMAYVGVAADAAEARATAEALAAENLSTPELVTLRTYVGTPDQIAARMRALTEAGVRHFVCIVSQVYRPDRFMDHVELLAREVFPRVRA